MATYSSHKAPIFDGNERHFELWEIKFLGIMRLKGLHKIFSTENDEIEETLNPDQNALAFAELILCLDDRSLSLIIRDARDEGRKAFQILRNHYLPKGKPRIITLYTELTSLRCELEEGITDFIVRAETIAAQLRNTGETISDGLLTAMIIKALPVTYKPFVAVINQKDDTLKFSDFKVLLRNYEDTEKAQSSTTTTVMSVINNSSSHSKWCSNCKMKSHNTNDCYKRNKTAHTQSRSNRHCTYCNTNSHDTKFCRFKNRSSHFNNNHSSVKTFTNENDKSYNENHHHFTFVVKDTDIETSNHNINAFLIDSGATVHVLKDKEKFISFDETFRPERHIIQLADGGMASAALAQGDAAITLTDQDGHPHEVILKNALYVPTFTQNILSVSAVTQAGATVNFLDESGTLKYREHVFDIRKSVKNNLYFVNGISSMTKGKTLEKWHQVLGHCNAQDIIKLEKHVIGMRIIGDKSTKIECETCVLGKMCNVRNRQADTRATTPLELVHLDLAGPIEPMAKDGFRYSLICVDDFSNLTVVYFLKQKSDATEAFRKYLCDMRPYGRVKSIRSDQGGEFISREFSSVLIENLIRHEKSAPYSPHQNGTAERHWRTLFEMARCLLLESGLPKLLWAYALMASAFIRNRCYNSRLGKTSFEAMTQKKPNIATMHTFGQKCFALNQNPKKLDSRSEKGIFVGYDRDSPSYLVYFPDTGKVKKVRCVTFFDKNECQHSSDNDNEHYDYVIKNDEIDSDNSNSDSNPKDVPEPYTSDSDQKEDNAQHSPDALDHPLTDNNIMSSKRTITRPKHLDDYYCNYVLDDDDKLNVMTHYCYNAQFNMPQSYSEAMSSPQSNKWKEAIDIEMSSLTENDTFDIVKPPTDKNIIGGKWVFTVKTDKEENHTYKARYVAKGFSQIEGVDYMETFSPTVRMSSIRLISQLAIQHNLEIHQMDFKAAYLNAPIDCDIYVKQPEGFELKDENGKNYVLKLKKSLYGLKQSGRNWNNMLDKHLQNDGFVRSINDPCVYFDPNKKIYILVWVDDLLIASKPQYLMSIKKTFQDKFKMKDLGEVSYFLGIQFDRSGDEMTLCQSMYISKVLQRFNMTDCKPKLTPSEMKPLVYEHNSEPLNVEDLRLYKSMIGALIYIMTATRPDISFTVTRLSQFMTNAKQCHMQMAKHVLRYLKGTMNDKLTFKKCKNELKVSGSCDADWANSSDDRKSVTGYCFKLSDSGPLISWKSRKQQTVALSTCEAEYMSLVAATQEGKYLMSLLDEIMDLNQTQFTLLCDNQGAIALSKNPIKHQRSKHIDIKYHFIRQEISENRLCLEYVATDNNVADVFTKPVSRMKMQSFKTSLMG